VDGTTGAPFPWFSDQHDAGFVNNGERTLLVFDNGDTRHEKLGGNSRGQVWYIDQTNMVASLQLNADLGVYSQALGSAQLLQNGNHMFQAGYIKSGASVEVQSTEFTPEGTAVYQFQSTGPAQLSRLAAAGLISRHAEWLVRPGVRGDFA